MQIHQLIQGSPEWIAYRATHFNASDAPAMLGCSEYTTRSQLLHQLHTGIVPEVDAMTQRRFDEGHRIEALARPLAEKIIGEDLYPVVGSDGELSSSFDGLTMAEDTAFEHKTLNNKLRTAMTDQGNGYSLPLQYQVQMEQQLMVSGAERVLFMATAWDGDNLVEQLHCWYASDPALRAKIITGWSQFAKDLAAYVPAEVVIAPVAKPQMSLPSVSIQVNGSIALVDNLEAFGTALTAYVNRINKTPETDQDFADLEATVKTLKNAEEALDAAENGALAQTESIDSMRRTVGLYRETARTNRLLVEKLVKVEKENRRTKIIGDATAEFVIHMRGLNERLGKHYIPPIQPEFQTVVKGLKSIDSMRDKVATELARYKIEANAIADKIQINMNTLRELAKDHAFLFADAGFIVQKAPDDLTMLVKSRISDHQAAEEKRIEAQRAAIRAEELAKIERETAEKARIAEAERERAAKIEAERIQSEAEQKAKDDFAALYPLINAKADAEEAARIEYTLATAPPCHQTQVIPSTPPSLKLGQIAERLGFTLTAEFLKQLGFEPAATDKASKLFHSKDFQAICDALIQHIKNVSVK
jgi:putative phage-type endonuclease